MLPEIGEAGQKRLNRSKVAVIGLGGLGAPVTTYLAGAGVGTIVIVDPDTVSISNLQRQVLYTEADLGLPKTRIACDRLTSLNSGISIIPHAEPLDSDNGAEILNGCDLVIDCTDNYKTRYLIDDLCESLGIPWIYGSIGEFSGQVSIFGHKAGLRYRHLYPERAELCGLPQKTRGVIGTVPGVVGAVEANEAIKLLAGLDPTLDGRLWTIDLLTMNSHTIDLNPLKV